MTKLTNEQIIEKLEESRDWCTQELRKQTHEKHEHPEKTMVMSKHDRYITCLHCRIEAYHWAIQLLQGKAE